MTSPSETERFDAAYLVTFARDLLTQAGLETEKAQTVAEILVEGDLLGHDTHGLALLPSYLQELERGTMRRAGHPTVIADFPAALTWDGERLPGPWLVKSAIEVAGTRARSSGLASVSIRRSHHIGCLAAYLRVVTEQGFMILLTCSDANAAAVAPYGGTRAVYSPNPIAAAWPTQAGPVMLDVSQSITTVGMVRRARAENKRLRGPWLLDAKGMATSDPSVMSATPKGSLLPSGGLDHGHKGFSLGLLVEALTAGLAGHGRVDSAEGWSATVYVQIWAPQLYSGNARFLREMTRLSELCHASPTLPGRDQVRLPGERGLQHRAAALAHGLALYPTILPALAPWSEKYQIPLPSPRPP